MSDDVEQQLEETFESLNQDFPVEPEGYQPPEQPAEYEEPVDPRDYDGYQQQPQPREDEFQGERRRSRRRSNDSDDRLANEEPQRVEAPSTWPEEAKREFGRLPKPAQEFMATRYRDMDADYTRKNQELSERARQYDAFDEIVRPRLEHIHLSGMTVPQYFAQVTAASDFAGKDPVGFVKWLCGNRQIDVTQFANALVGLQTEEDMIDPELKKRDETIAELQQQQQALMQYVNGQQAAEAEHYQNSLYSDIETFFSAKDQFGNLLHPNGQELAPQMSRLLDSDFASTLEEAYQKAVQLNPSLGQQQRAPMPRRMEPPVSYPDYEASRQRAARAARAGASVGGSPIATTREARTDGSALDTMSDVWDEHFQ